MKYISDDGKNVFKTADECLLYEKKAAVKEGLKARVEKYLSMKEYKNDGARRRALGVIMSWIDYDMIDNPTRYFTGKLEAEDEPEVSAIVRNVSGE